MLYLSRKKVGIFLVAVTDEFRRKLRVLPEERERRLREIFGLTPNPAPFNQIKPIPHPVRRQLSVTLILTFEIKLVCKNDTIRIPVKSDGSSC